jgi:hypothetical protein
VGFLALTFIPAGAQSPSTVIEARVAVDSFTNQATDEISFHVLNNKDKQLLANILQALSAQFVIAPTNVTYFDRNPDDSADLTASVTFNMPIVSRLGGSLPIDQFIQAFYPVVSRVSVLYAIHGAYAYQPFHTRFSASSVHMTEDPPNISSHMDSEPFAIYLADVSIVSQQLTTTQADTQKSQQAARQKHRRMIIAIAIGVALVIIALGVLFALLLPRRKEPDMTTGEKNNGNKQ